MTRNVSQKNYVGSLDSDQYPISHLDSPNSIPYTVSNT